MIKSAAKIAGNLVITAVFTLSPLGFGQTVQAQELPEQALAHIPVCTVGNPDIPRCHARVVVDKKGKPQTTTSPTGYGPGQFTVAYNINPISPTTKTIAIVDAYNDPNALSDLNTYSTQYGIPTMASCAVATGSTLSPCFQKVDQRGGTAYPGTNSGWALEISLDVQAAHAICQNCNILLVEADSNSYSNLMAGVDRAFAMGANVISNSYGSGEFYGETSYDSHLNHPGVAITFSSGDNGYGSSYPAASQYVTAVGGTSLFINAGNSYNYESAWSGGGSGCSSYEGKPSWQNSVPTNCPRRMIADVSADADPNTGASVYDTVPYSGQTGWFQVGGTSLAAPIVAAVYALGATPSGVQAASLPYTAGNYATNLHDVTAGNNGRCFGRPSNFCHASAGYDGPTGLGTPKGTSAF